MSARSRRGRTQHGQTPRRTRRRSASRVAAAPALAAALALLPAYGALGTPAYTPGSDGVGDPYYPLDGNGGYDVGHYDLAIDYDPGSRVLSGVATISAVATQGLSRFNLDLDGLTVRSVTVDGRTARWTRALGELTVRPTAGLAEGAAFTTVVRYDGVPSDRKSVV